MDPPKGTKAQAALVSVTGFIDAKTDSGEQLVQSLLVDDVQLLAPAQADPLKPMLVKMLYFAALAGQVSRKRAREPWSPEENPANAAACRVLGAQPNRTIASRLFPYALSFHIHTVESAGQPALIRSTFCQFWKPVHASH